MPRERENLFFNFYSPGHLTYRGSENLVSRERVKNLALRKSKSSPEERNILPRGNGNLAL